MVVDEHVSASSWNLCIIAARMSPMPGACARVLVVVVVGGGACTSGGQPRALEATRRPRAPHRLPPSK